jgi:cysteine dioxygenase
MNIKDFTVQLSDIPEAEFTDNNVLDFLRTNRVDPGSLNPYLYFCEETDHYTRNLIHKTELFELIAICWDIGQKSPIHNHRDQRCWMAVPYGKLQIHNFALVKKDPGTGFCELRSSGQVLMDPGNPQEVDAQEPIHQVLNLPVFGSKAISLHVYSRPFDSCEIYDLKGKKYWDTPLVNTSEYGVLKTELPVVKVQL